MPSASDGKRVCRPIASASSWSQETRSLTPALRVLVPVREMPAPLRNVRRGIGWRLWRMFMMVSEGIRDSVWSATYPTAFELGGRPDILPQGIAYSSDKRGLACRQVNAHVERPVNPWLLE